MTICYCVYAHSQNKCLVYEKLSSLLHTWKHNFKTKKNDAIIPHCFVCELAYIFLLESVGKDKPHLKSISYVPSTDVMHDAFCS